MLNKENRFLVMEILHRLELKESVSIDELIYLYRLANDCPEVEQWVNKLLFDKQPLINSETYPSIDLIAA